MTYITSGKKETGTVLDCLRQAAHHADWTTFSPPLTSFGQKRAQVIESEIKAAAMQLRRIKEAADMNDLMRVKALLEGHIEY